VVNFAHGEFLAIGAYAYVAVARHTTISVLQLVVVLAAGALTGALVYAITRYLLRRSGVIEVVIGTLAVSVALQAALRQKYSDNSQPITPWAVGQHVSTVFGVRVPSYQLLLILASILVTAILFVLLRYTSIGKSMVAVAENQTRAALTGIPVTRMLLLSWALGGAIAALGGMLVGPSLGVYPAMGANVLLGSFVAALLGGFASIPGALIGGLLLGLVQTYAVDAFGSTYQQAIIFAIVLIVLLVRPTGLISSRRLRRF
jgi:branched-chain amino acid transport system permease protein